MKRLTAELGCRTAAGALCVALGGLLVCATGASAQTTVSRTPGALIISGNPNTVNPPTPWLKQGEWSGTAEIENARKLTQWELELGMPDRAGVIFGGVLQQQKQLGWSDGTALEMFRERMKDLPSVEAKAAMRVAITVLARRESLRVTPKGRSSAPSVAEHRLALGTGFFVTDDGYLVTCEHVVSGATSFHVRSGGFPLPARLIKKDREIDVAVLKVDGTFRASPVLIDASPDFSFPALPIPAQPQVKLGDPVFTIGFPNPDVQGVKPKLTRGEISSLAGIHDDPCYFQVSVPVQPGNSGGALVDECGNVVGVVTARLDDVATYESSGALPQNVNYGLKSRLVYAFLNKVPELAGKLKAAGTTRDREAALATAERAAVLVIAE